MFIESHLLASVHASFSSSLQLVDYSLCSITINPITPSNTVLSQGCSDSMIVT